jgi:hypothetical protein
MIMHHLASKETALDKQHRASDASVTLDVTPFFFIHRSHPTPKYAIVIDRNGSVASPLSEVVALFRAPSSELVKLIRGDWHDRNVKRPVTTIIISRGCYYPREPHLSLVLNFTRQAFICLQFNVICDVSAAFRISFCSYDFIRSDTCRRRF